MTLIKPSILISNTFDPLSRDEEHVMKLYQTIADLNYYNAIETRIIFNTQVQKEFADLATLHEWYVTFWVTGNLNNLAFRLNNLNESERIKAVDQVKIYCDLAVKSNAKAIGFCSGKTEGHPLEEQEQFFKSVVSILVHARKYEELDIIIEPLDSSSDKRNTLGDLETSLSFFQRINSSGLNHDKRIRCCIDTAHFALNNDNLSETIKELSIYSDRVHFANAILDPSHIDYGDKHIAIGDPGFLDKGYCIELYEQCRTLDFISKDTYLTIEERVLDQQKMFEKESEHREFLNTLRAI